MAAPIPTVRVGVAAIVKDGNGRMVVGIRKGSHGAGTLILRVKSDSH